MARLPTCSPTRSNACSKAPSGARPSVRAAGLLAALLIAAPALAQDPPDRPAPRPPEWKASLKADRVTVVGGEYRYRTWQRCVTEGSERTLYVQSSAKAPRSAIGRDFFLWFVGGLEIRFLAGLEGEGAKVTCRSTPELDRDPDLRLQIVMNELGFRVDVAYSGGRTDSQTQAWAEVL